MDPRHDARSAELFWHPDTYTRILTAVVDREHLPGLNSPLALASIGCRKSILAGPGNEQHLVLRNDRHALQILCTGDAVSFDPVAMALVIDTLPEVEPRVRLVRRFAELCRGPGTRTESPDRLRRSLRLGHALTALDGWLNGASYREIAGRIFGAERVATQWGEDRRSLKDRTIRLVRKGRRLMEGGYRDLLR